MLCYRCGSYTPDGSRQCDVCSQPFAERRGRSTPQEQVTGRRGIPPFGGDDVIAGRYRVIEPIARGAAGWVLRALDTQTQSDVALKIIAANLLQAEDERAAFVRTVKQARRLEHPNLVRILDEGRDGEHVYYAATYLEGLSLRKIIDLRTEKGQRFSLEEIAPVLEQLVAALEACTDWGPHGALRPSSIIVLPDLLKVTALPHLRGLPQRPFVAAQSGLNSLAYLAPEARQGAQTIDGRADVYSLAVIAGEMLTGQVYGADPRRWTDAEATLPAPIVAVLARSLRDVPNGRDESPRTFLGALLATLDRPQPSFLDEDTTAPDLDPARAETTGQLPRPVEFTHQPQRPNTPPRARGSLALWAALLAAGALSAAWWWNRQHSPTGEDPRAQDNTTVRIEPAPPQPVEPAPPVAEPQAPARPPAPPPAPPPVSPASAAPPPMSAAVPPASTLPPRSPVVPDVPEPPAAPPTLAAATTGCAPGMVQLGGTAKIGADGRDPMRGFGELARREQELAQYCVDLYEYPNQRGATAMVQVTWDKAQQLCKGRGKRLCSEAEWEHACSGNGAYRFATGDVYKAGTCNTGGEGRRPQPAGTFRDCRSAAGIADLSGNVAEWTTSRWSEQIGDRVIKGGSADQAAYTARCAARMNGAPALRSDVIGFRCCKDAE